MVLAQAEQKPEPTIYQHSAKSEWGRGTLITEAENKRRILWEDERVRAIHESHWDRLVEVEMPLAQRKELDETLRKRRQAADAAKKRAARRKKAGPRVRKAPVSWAVQLAIFEKMYPGGFEDPKFKKKERGTAGEEPEKIQKAMRRAQEILAEQRLADQLGANLEHEVFDELLEMTTLVKSMLHFTETKKLKELDAEHKTKFVQALQTFLYGEGSLEERFDALIGAFPAEPRPSWTVATFFPAFVAPHDYVLIRPTFWLKEAAILEKTVDYDPRPSGKAYDQFMEVATTTRKRLEGADQTPRDLIDVYVFAWRSLSPKAVKAFSGGK